MESQVPRIIGSNAAVFSLAVIAVALRFISRRLMRAKLWWDDYLIVFALLLEALIEIASIIWVNYGLGKHIRLAPSDSQTIRAKVLFVCEILYTLLICSIKFSVLCFYWRIFKQSKIRIPIYAVGLAVSCWGIALTLVTIFSCTPVSGFWEKFDPESTVKATCNVNVNKFFIANSIPNIVTDAVVIAIPVPFIWKLNLPRARKFALLITFILSAFIVGVSAARFYFITELNLHSPDFTWNFVNVQIWTTLEGCIGIICACLPSLRPILSLIMTGSVERSIRPKSGNITNTGRINRAWPLQLKNEVTGPYQISHQIDRSHFGKLPDEEHRSSRVTTVISEGPVAHVVMRGLGQDGMINVRTDILVSHWRRLEQ